jgi:hypothetical protein
MNKSIALAATLAAASVASGQVINGGFEQPNGGGISSVGPGATYGNWTNAGPSGIEFVQAVPNGGLPGLEFSAYEGQYWVDLVGVGAPSAIFQNITGLVPGGQYQIDWAQAGNVWGANFDFTMEVVWNNAIVASYTQNHGGFDGAAMNWQLHSVVVTANLTAGPNQLMFRAVTGGGARGPALDAVSMTLVPSPGAAALLGVGAVTGLRRRRQR